MDRTAEAYPNLNKLPLAPTATMGRVDARHTVLASPTTTFEDEAASDFLSDAL